MLIRRCAWHPAYFGRPRVLGVAALCGSSRRGYTDGICRACAALLRAGRPAGGDGGRALVAEARRILAAEGA